MNEDMENLRREDMENLRRKLLEADASSLRFDRLLKITYAERLAQVEADRDRLRDALRGYHDLAPTLAECLNDIGAMLAYSDLHLANQRAEEALARSPGEGTAT